MAVMMIRAETESGSIYQFRVFTPVQGDQVTHVMRLPGRGALSFFEEASLVKSYTPLRVGHPFTVRYVDPWCAECSVHTSISTPIVKLDVWSDQV